MYKVQSGRRPLQVIGGKSLGFRLDMWVLDPFLNGVLDSDAFVNFQ